MTERLADDTTDSFGPMARRILHAALDEQRAAELLQCLFNNGSATVDPDGKLVLATIDVLNQIGQP